ncbi:MAG: DUF1045 domain-containing protein [Notoacmeibacter sp.]
MTLNPNSETRYAIYLAPRPETALWQFGSTVLGYDAATGNDIAGFSLPSINQTDWKSATARARTYGFHATLKAPFRLLESESEQSLVGGLKSLAKEQPALSTMALNVSVLDENETGGFLALTPTQADLELRDLEAKVVKGLDNFRAPLTKDEIAKRKPESLSVRQAEYLSNYGYPYVLEEFRVHFTLCDRLPNAAQIAAEMHHLLLAQISAPSIEINELVLFKQVAANARFHIIARAPLGEKQS